ncbi:MAG TPA: hypothetical protein PK007_11335, partial [Candidatus Kapabacteria bacterium]|nr:hypothetical protein [Candidatus Kapabacteria bacterium]
VSYIQQVNSALEKIKSHLQISKFENFELLDTSDNILAFIIEKKILCIANFSSERVELPIKELPVEDEIYHFDIVHHSPEKVENSLSFEAFSGSVFILQ